MTDDRLYFTDSDEANELIARDPMALLIGFALDQQERVQKAFYGPLAEDRLEVGLGDRGRVERAQALLEHERPRERLLDGDLLVEREADEQRHRVRDQQRVGLVGVGEVEAIGHGSIVVHARGPADRPPALGVARGVGWCPYARRARM